MPYQKFSRENHPWWYFEYYERVFGISRSYEKEISLISSLAPLKGRVVEEIGAGTGCHVSEILKQGAESVVAVDIDPAAIKILDQKFNRDDRVTVIHADGFVRREPADILTCFFSILQQGTSPPCIEIRLQNLLGRTNLPGSWIFIELIDVDRHVAANPPNKTSVVISEHKNRLFVETVAEEFGSSIRYFGNLGGEPVEYSVPLIRLDITTIREAIGDRRHLTVTPMSSSQRKSIVSIRTI